MSRKEAEKLKKAICGYAAGNYAVGAVEEIDSTNRAMKQMAEQGAPEGAVLFAEYQSAGRGRLGRSFFSPAGSGLYFSVLLRPEGAAADALRITAAAGVAVARAVKDVLGIELLIKWVNDLYLENKKVCGILAEGAIAPDGRLSYCVLGIGLNVFAPREGFGDLENIAGALLQAEPETELRGRLAAKILDEFSALYADLASPALMEEYRRCSYLQGKAVTAVRGEERIRGIVEGIGDDGALLLRAEDGSLLALSAGEVRLEDYR